MKKSNKPRFWVACGCCSILALVMPAQADPPVVDLAISTGAADITALANQTDEVQFVISNVGTGPTSSENSAARFVAGLYLVTEGNLPDELLGESADIQIPDLQTTITVTLSFTAPDAPGVYYLYAYTDKDNIIDELNEQNNYSELITLQVLEPPDVVGPLADLRVTATHLTDEPAVANERMYLEITVKNTGNASTQTITNDDLSGRFDVAIYQYALGADGQVQTPDRWDLWLDSCLDFEDPAGLAGKVSPDPCDPNEREAYDDDPLSLYLRGLFDPTTVALLDAYDENTDSQPSVALRTALVLELNLIIAGPSLYDAERFSQVEMPITLLDLIARTPQGENLIQLNRLLLEQAYPDEIRSHLHGPLDAGASLDNVGLSYPAPSAAGTYYYQAVVDKGDLVLEANPSNNRGDILIVNVVEAQPDLKIAATTITARQGNTHNIMTTVENVGTDATSAPATLSLYLFTDTTLGPLASGQIVAQQQLNDTFVRGAQQLVNLSFDLADPTQTYYLAALIETDAGDPDSDTSNNWGETITLQLPDLTVTDTQVTESPDSDVVQVMVRVANANQADTQEFDIELFLLDDPTDDLSGMTALTSISDMTLNAGESKTTVIIFETAEAGYLLAVVDRANDIPEADETNNEGELMLLHAPDLLIPDLQIGTTRILPSYNSDELRVAVTVSNSGSAAVNDSFNVDLYFLDDPNADLATAVPVASNTVAQLSIGESLALDISPAAPESAGNYYLVAMADQADAVNDLERSNNRGEALLFEIPGTGLTIRNMTVRADTDRSNPWDSFVIAGTIDGTLQDLEAAGSITVRVATRWTTIFTETIDVAGKLIVPGQDTESDQNQDDAEGGAGGFGINWNSFSGLLGTGGAINGRVSSNTGPQHTIFRYESPRSSGIASMVMKLKENWEKGIGNFRIIAKKVNLTELTSPIIVQISFGDYTGAAVVDENTINGQDSVPMLLMSGIADTLRVDRALVNKKGNSLAINGAIAAATLGADLANKDLTVTWAGQNWLLPAGTFDNPQRQGLHRYVCRPKVIAGLGTVIALIDFDRAAFRILIKNAATTISGPISGMRLGISFPGFDATAVLQ